MDPHVSIEEYASKKSPLVLVSTPRSRNLGDSMIILIILFHDRRAFVCLVLHLNLENPYCYGLISLRSPGATCRVIDNCHLMKLHTWKSWNETIEL